MVPKIGPQNPRNITTLMFWLDFLLSLLLWQNIQQTSKERKGLFYLTVPGETGGVVEAEAGGS